MTLRTAHVDDGLDLETALRQRLTDSSIVDRLMRRNSRPKGW